MIEPTLYVPSMDPLPPSGPLPNVPTSWHNLDRLLPDIIKRFNIRTDLAIEFGVWHGYSTAGLANNFTEVVGVDMFIGDKLPGTMSAMVDTTRETLKPWPNVILIESRWENFVFSPCDLIHIDIEHTFDQTYRCGKAALTVAPVVIFHDTESFPEVKQAVARLAEESGREFLNWPHNEGLGILGEVQR